MRNLLSVSVVLLLLGCRSVYDGFESADLPVECLLKLKPSYNTSWYSAQVDVVGKHFSGLLLIKEVSSTTTRIIFTNEPGIKFFDLEFSNDTFKVHYIIKQLDKKLVIKTLKKDFELILMNQVVDKVASYKRENEYYYQLESGKENIFLVTNKNCSSLSRVELMDKRKKKVQVEIFGEKNIPDSLHLRHFNFNMQIALKRLPQ